MHVDCESAPSTWFLLSVIRRETGMYRIGVEIFASAAIFQCSDYVIMWIKEVFRMHVMLIDAASYFEEQQQFLKQVYPSF